MGRNRRWPQGRPPRPSTTAWNHQGFRNEASWHAENRHHFRHAPPEHGWPARHQHHQQTHSFRYPRPPPIVRNEYPPPSSRQRPEKLTPVPVRQLQTNVANQVTPQVNQIKPQVNQIKPQANHVKAQVNHVKPQVNQVKPQANQVKPQVNHVTPQANQIKAQVNQIKPQANQVNLQVNQIKPQANHVNAQVNHVTPQVNQVKPQVNQIKPQANQVKPQVNHVTPQVNQVNPQANQGKAQANHVIAIPPAPRVDPTLPRFDSLSPTVVTFKQLVNRLLSTTQSDYIFQRKTVVEMIYIYLQLESVEKKFESLAFLLNKEQSDGYGTGMDYKGKLLLWTLCELLSHYSGFFENYEVEMAGLINKRFDQVMHKSKEDNFKEILAIRQQLASILPFFNFSVIDESADRRYPYGKLTNFLTWAKSVRLVPPANQRNFINLWNPEDRKKMELIDKSLADAKRTKILPPPPPKLRNEIPKFERVLPSINRPRTPPIKLAPKILDIIDIEDTDRNEAEEFDRRILFSPVPSEESEDDDNSQAGVISNVAPIQNTPIPTLAPLQNFDEFLKSCREEKEKIETEKLNAFSNMMTRLQNNQNQNTSTKTTDKQPVEHSDGVSGKAPRNETLEAIKKRIQEANVAALKAKEISPPATKKAKTVVCTTADDKEKASFWNSSIVPSIDCIVGKKVEKLKSNPKALPQPKEDNGKDMSNQQPTGKVMEDIKRKLQKTQVFTSSVITTKGKTREIILPIDFSSEEYLDLLFSPSFSSQGIKTYKGKKVISIIHKLTKI